MKKGVLMMVVLAAFVSAVPCFAVTYYLEGEDFDSKLGDVSIWNNATCSNGQAANLDSFVLAGVTQYNVGSHGLPADAYYVAVRLRAYPGDRSADIAHNGSIIGKADELEITDYTWGWVWVKDANGTQVTITTTDASVIAASRGGSDMPYVDVIAFLANGTTLPDVSLPVEGYYSPMIAHGTWFLEGEDFTSSVGDARVWLYGTTSSSHGNVALLANLAENGGPGSATYDLGTYGLPPATYYLAARLRGFANDRSVNFALDGSYLGKADETGIAEYSWGWVWVKDVNDANVSIITDGLSQLLTASRGGNDNAYFDVMAFMLTDDVLPGVTVPVEGYFIPVFGEPRDCAEVKQMGMLYSGDSNEDCYVDFLDFVLVADNWLGCNDPTDSSCY